VLAVSAPETPFTLTACWAISAVLEAEKARVAELPDVRDREDGETVTPADMPVRVMDTDPVKPFCPAAETCTVWLAPCANVMLVGDSETVKLGVGGGVGLPLPLPAVPPPQPVMDRQRRATATTKECLPLGTITPYTFIGIRHKSNL
jgi:hypothetical protein